jgi:hypothetical protein
MQGSLLDDWPTVSTTTSAGERKKRRSVMDAVDWAADKVPLASGGGAGANGRAPRVDQGAYVALGAAQPRSQAPATRHATARLSARLQVAFAALPGDAQHTRSGPGGRLESPAGLRRIDEAGGGGGDDDSTSVGALTVDSSLWEADRATSHGRSLGGRFPDKAAATRSAPATNQQSGGLAANEQSSAAPLPGEAQMASEWESAAVGARDFLAAGCPHAQAIVDARAAGRHLAGSLAIGAPPGEPSSAELGSAGTAAANLGSEAKVEGLDHSAALAAAVLPSLSSAAWAAQSEALARGAFSFKHVDLCAAALADHVNAYPPSPPPTALGSVVETDGSFLARGLCASVCRY